MIIAIVQARMGSTRFPGKVLRAIAGKSLLQLYLNRVRPARLIDKIIVATTTQPADDAIEKVAQAAGVAVFRGSENDLLDRYYQCARQHGEPGATVVRLTSDDVFVDHQVIDRAIAISASQQADFVTNHFEPTYPEGLDVEVYSFRCLAQAWQKATLLSEREHVFPYIQNHQEEFKIINFKQDKDYSHLRWTVDYECDYEMAKVVYDYLYQDKPIFLQDDIIALIKRHPEIAAINSHIKRKEGVNKTKAEDRVVK